MTLTFLKDFLKTLFDALFWLQKVIWLIFYTLDTLLDSLDPFNEKKIEKILNKVRKSSQGQSHDFDFFRFFKKLKS